jgi:hypothetical protein
MHVLAAGVCCSTPWLVQDTARRALTSLAVLGQRWVWLTQLTARAAASRRFQRS